MASYIEKPPLIFHRICGHGMFRKIGFYSLPRAAAQLSIYVAALLDGRLKTNRLLPTFIISYYIIIVHFNRQTDESFARDTLK